MKFLLYFFKKKLRNMSNVLFFKPYAVTRKKNVLNFFQLGFIIYWNKTLYIQKRRV